jgi:hypothetical protein
LCHFDSRFKLLLLQFCESMANVRGNEIPPAEAVTPPVRVIENNR